MNSMETGQDSIENAFSDKAIRQGFMKKVFAILSVQLVMSFGACIIGSLGEPVRIFLAQNFWIAILALVGSLFVFCPLICSKNLRREAPLNYILLFTFTFCYSILLAYVGAAYDTRIVVLAVTITGIIVIELTLFAMQTKIDFTYCSGIVFVLFMCFFITLITTGIYSAFAPKDRLIEAVFGGIGAGLMGLFIVIDVQMIVGGGRAIEISPEEYVYGALIIYLDVIRMFLYILQIFAGKK